MLAAVPRYERAAMRTTKRPSREVKCEREQLSSADSSRRERKKEREKERERERVCVYGCDRRGGGIGTLVNINTRASG